MEHELVCSANTHTAMALPPKLKGHRLLFFSDDPAAPAPTEASVADPLHTIELYLDYVCPFSASM